MSAQACGALLPRLRDTGWPCDGTNLVVVMEATGSVPPVVLRRDLLKCMDHVTALWVAEHGWTEFPGGDHVHLCLPRWLAQAREE